MVNTALYAPQFVEVGADVAIGRYQPGLGRLGSLIATVVIDSCGLLTGYCPHGLATSLAVASAAYGYASRRGRVDRDILAAGFRSIIAHMGQKDAAELLKALEAVAPAEHEKLVNSIGPYPSIDFQDLALTLSRIAPSYICITDPSTCIRLASELKDPFNRVEIVSFWLEKFIDKCIKVDDKPDPANIKELLALDVKCRASVKDRVGYCIGLGELISVLAFLSTLIP